MNSFQLAKLIDWAGEIKTRKKLQKVVYLLQFAGFDLKVDFILHHYGPYSHELARLTDQMVHANLLEEEQEPNALGMMSYSYRLPKTVQGMLEASEKSEQGRQWMNEMGQAKTTAEKLFPEPVKKLEYAATIAYFYGTMQKDWSKAVDAAAKFKGTRPDDSSMKSAEQLAKEISAGE